MFCAFYYVHSSMHVVYDHIASQGWKYLLVVLASMSMIYGEIMLK